VASGLRASVAKKLWKLLELQEKGGDLLLPADIIWNEGKEAWRGKTILSFFGEEKRGEDRSIGARPLALRTTEYLPRVKKEKSKPTAPRGGRQKAQKGKRECPNVNKGGGYGASTYSRKKVC